MHNINLYMSLFVFTVTIWGFLPKILNCAGNTSPELILIYFRFQGLRLGHVTIRANFILLSFLSQYSDNQHRVQICPPTLPFYGSAFIVLLCCLHELAQCATVAWRRVGAVSALQSPLQWLVYVECKGWRCVGAVSAPQPPVYAFVRPV